MSWLGWLPAFGDMAPYLGGGLAGALFSQGVQRFGSWWNRPRLIAAFGDAGDGSIIEQQSTGSDNEQWVRVKVKNEGRSTARNVRVLVTSIANRTSDRTEWKFDREIIDCSWSHIAETKIDIPSKTWRFADIFFLTMSDTRSELKFTGKGANNIPGRIEILSISMALTGDNCKTTKAILPLRYEGLKKGMAFYKPA